HFKGNSFDKAASYYQKIIDEFPKSSYLPAAYYSLGWSEFQKRDFEKSLKYFTIVEQDYPKEPQAKDSSFKIIECLYNLKKYSQLVEKARASLRAYSGDSYAHVYFNFYLAEADYYIDDFQGAIDAYRKVIESNPDKKLQALSKLGTGWSYLKSKKYKESESQLWGVEPQDLDEKSLSVLLLGKAILMSETDRPLDAKNNYEELLNSAKDPLVLMQAYLGKADALYKLNLYDESKKVYLQALGSADSGSIPREIIDKLHYNLAWAHLKLGEFKEAIAEFQNIVKETGDKIVKVSALCQIGDTYQASGEFNKAVEVYDKVLKEYPDSFYTDYVQYQLGLTMLKSSNYDAAIMSFLSLTKNFPKSKLLDDAYYALGLAYFQRQDYDSSTEIFRKFQSDFSDSSLKAQGIYLLGSSLFNLEKYGEAIEVFKDIVRMHGQDIELAQKAEYEIADCMFQMGNEKEAVERFKWLRSKYPDSSLTAEIMWWLGEYYYRHNDLVLARRYFLSLINDYPKSNLIADAYYILGSSFEEESRHEEAIENFKKVAEMGKTDLAAQAAIAMAGVYAKQNKADAAFNIYNTALKEYPHLAALIYPKMADLYYDLTKFNEAIDYYRKSLEVVPLRQVPGIQFRIAEVFQAQGLIDRAVEEYLKVTYLYSDNPQFAVKALLRVAAIYEDGEKFNEAERIYEKIISLNVEEAKFARERIDWIRAHRKGGKG
ncbi:MAG: tetratricopeptide repeat protein, partial [Candidatus Omnitrophota bacterium]